MRVLQVVKTSDGATWAARQAAELVKLGIEVHVAVPAEEGTAMPLWKASGAQVHIVDLAFPLTKFVNWKRILGSAQELVGEIKPDIIHSHFLNTSLTLRLALGRNASIPRVFQVPGPLHMEYRHSRTVDLWSAGASDFWIGSSNCIVDHYLKASVPAQRVFLSYYGLPIRSDTRTGFLRRKLGLDDSVKIIGNANLIYPPKYWLGQTRGLKCHEDVIAGLARVIQVRPDVVGVLIGGTFGNRSTSYEMRLRNLADRQGRGRILMPGNFTAAEVNQSWPDFDCAVHVPLSENCGGAVEPLFACVPTVASNVGGLPEIVIEGKTGALVPVRRPEVLAGKVLEMLDHAPHYKSLARAGQRLVTSMFDVRRTAAEVLGIYRHILEGAPRPPEFISEATLNA
jgi:glycosyltransferase involved in cell wall biosynthesis